MSREISVRMHWILKPDKLLIARERSEGGPAGSAGYDNLIDGGLIKRCAEVLLFPITAAVTARCA